MYDKNNTFGTGQAVTATAASTDVIDTDVAGRRIGDGEPLFVIVSVTEAATSAGSTTVDFALQDSADNSTFADTAVKVSAVPKATLVVGYEVMKTAIPFGLRRYLRMNYTVNTANLTAGKFTAFVADDVQANNAFAPGYTVS